MEADAGDNFDKSQGVYAKARKQAGEDYDEDDDDEEVDAMEEDDEVNEIINKLPLPPLTIPIGQVENDLVSYALLCNLSLNL